MITTHSNLTNYTDADGYVVPINARDRYYAQDFQRDAWYNLDRIGLLSKEILGGAPFIFEGGVVSKGVGDTLDITACYGLVGYDVAVPDSFAALPPSTKTEMAELMVYSPAQTNMAIAGATLDGMATNYVKLTYTETNGGTRDRSKGTGNYAYDRSPSYAFVVDTVAPDADTDIVLATLVGTAGGAFTFATALRTRGFDSLVTANKKLIEALNETNHFDVCRVVTASGTPVTLAVTDRVIFVTGAANQVINLPAFGSTYYGKKWTIINLQPSNTVTITPDGTDVIDADDVMNGNVVLGAGTYDTVSIIGYPAAAVNAEWFTTGVRVVQLPGCNPVAKEIAYDCVTANDTVVYRAGITMTLWTGYRWVTRTLDADYPINDSADSNTKYPYAYYDSATDALVVEHATTVPVWSAADGFWIKTGDRTRRWLGTQMPKSSSTVFYQFRVIASGDGAAYKDVTPETAAGISLHNASLTANTPVQLVFTNARVYALTAPSNILSFKMQYNLTASAASNTLVFVKTNSTSGERVWIHGAGAGGASSVDITGGAHIEHGTTTIWIFASGNTTTTTVALYGYRFAV